MAEQQSFQNHTHRPTETGVLWLLSLGALILIVMQFFGYSTRDWATLLLVMAMFVVGWISRLYIVRLQDRIIMLEMKVRAAEILPAGQDAQLAKLTKQQIVALRFASDDELGSLLERAVRENMNPKDIKAAIRTWRADLFRT
jgi:uncharacterized protein DUF6526